MDEILRQHIIQELALNDAPKEEVDEVVTGIGGLIMELVMTQITDTLDDEAVILFERVLSSADGESKELELSQFLAEHVPNLEEIIATCSVDVLEEYKKLS